MANHKSALKRIRSNEKKRVLNKYQHKTTRNAIKALRLIEDKTEATAKLVERLGGEIMGISFIVDLPFLGGSKKLSSYRLNWLVSYDSE